jgi:TolB-like protein
MLSPELIRRQVQQILSSGHFDASVRNRRFLEFIVDQTLAGNGDRLKGYTIALEVFDRDPSFDPQLDPVVRIEAGRLRRSLERYYLTEGKTSGVIVSIPKGKYVPQFEIRSRAQEFGGFDTEMELTGDHVSLIVAPVLDQPSSPEEATFDTALIEEIITEIYSKHREIEIVVPAIGAGDGLECEFSTTPSKPEYVLRGSVRRSENGIRIIFHLAGRHTGHLLWTRSFDQESTSVDMISTPREIAHEIVDSVTAALERAMPREMG